MRLGLLILGAACALLGGCYVPTVEWPPRDPVEHVWVPPEACDVRNKQVVDCFDHVHFVVGEVLVMQAPVCANVTVRHWSDKLPNGVVTIFYGRPDSYTVIGEASDKPVLAECIQHPLRYPVPQLFSGPMMLEKPDRIYCPNGYSNALPRAGGVPIPENPDDKVYSDKYVPEP
jgi:hypothetical protein